MIKFLEENIVYYKVLYIFYAILSVTIFREIPYFSTIFSMIMVVISFIYFCIFIYNGTYKKINKLRYLLILFLILQCSTFFISKNYVSDIIRLVFNGIYFLIISNNINNKKGEENKLFKIISPLLFCIIFISLMMYVFNISININNNIYGKLPEIDYYKSFVGLTVNSNTIGIMSSFLIIISIHLLISCDKGIWSNFIFILIGVISLYLSGSRGAIAMILVYSITIFILFNKKRKVLMLFTSIFLLTSIGIVLYYLGKSNIDVVSTGRSVLWENAFNLINKNKLFGVGTTSFVDIMKENSHVSLPGIDKGGLHNIYIQIALCNGLIAFFTFIIFIFLSIFIFLKKILFNDYNKINISLFSILISILSLNLFESTLIYICSFIALIFWICIGELFSNLNLE